MTETVADVETPGDAVTEAVVAQNDAAVKAAKSAPKAGKPAKSGRNTSKKPRAKAKLNARAIERNEKMTPETNTMFAGFGAFPGVTGFDKLFTEAAGRGEEAVKRSRKAAEELTEFYRGNIEAFAQAGRIAATGAQSIGQHVAAKSRDSLEQTANTVRSFAEAKSPTELLQLQSDFARTAFDRFVEESSSLTESMIKLAGEAFQPISNRASATVDKFNEISA